MRKYALPPSLPHSLDEVLGVCEVRVRVSAPEVREDVGLGAAGRRTTLPTTGYLATSQGSNDH